MMTLCTLVTGLLISSMASSPALGQTLAGRTVPSPIYGVTLDDVSNPSSTITSLSRLVRLPTARIVFDTGETPSYYAQPIQHFRPISYIMGELIDSSYMKHYKTVSAVQSWTNSYVNTLGSQVDIWEIGNEINGNWLSRQSNGADVMLRSRRCSISFMGGVAQRR
jgi:hypothetical protein